MSKLNLQPLKGFRDFLPPEARKRQYVINTLKQVLELYGFEPLETPTLEYEEVLTGKYGDEGEKLMYRFEDNGKRRVAMRYDQTVPLARIVARFQNELPIPFKRYQIQPVWRADNTQKGRYREFLQCDADIVGTESLVADAEVIAAADIAMKKLGFKNYKIKVNSRKLLFSKIKEAGVPENLTVSAIRIVDKIDKVGWKNIIEELVNVGIARKSASALENLLSLRQMQEAPEIDQVVELCIKLGVSSLSPDLTLARGLDYYTGIIFEITIDGYDAGSVAGGGRYDNLIGMFSGSKIPAVGFAFGFDRIMEALETLNLFPNYTNNSSARVLVTIFNEELIDSSISMANIIREKGITTDLYPDPSVKLDKQLKYADKKGIPYVLIMGPDEEKNNQVVIKNMQDKTQKSVERETFIKSPEQFLI